MDRDPVSFDVLENPLVGRGLAACVMVGLETVDGDNDIEPGEVIPVFRNGAKGAGDKLHVDATSVERGKDLLQFPIPNHRVAANERDMERAMTIHQVQNSLDQRVLLVIREHAEGYA